MRIVTLESVAGIGSRDGFLYEGSGYLLRFGIESADQFFAVQVPYIVDTLAIYVRQIMRVELLSNGHSGLRQAAVLISFQDSEANGERPEQRFEKLWDAPPASWSAACTDRLEIMRQRLIDFLQSAPPSVKARFLKDSKAALQIATTRKAPEKYSSYAAGLVCRVSYEASPPSIAEWRNILLHCSETLRRTFQPQHIHSLDLRAIPYTEDSYKADVDFLLPSLPVLYQVRSKLRYSSQRKSIARATAPPSSRSSYEGLSFTTGRPEDTLSPTEKGTLAKFDVLDTPARLHLWKKHLAKYFR
jgi:hypothetical protein